MKRSAVSFMDRFGAVHVARALQRSRAVVLTYHGVLNGAADYDYLNHNFIAAEAFDAQMRYVCRHYRPLALRDLVAAYRDGRTPPARSVVVTFDDGFANNFTVALHRGSFPAGEYRLKIYGLRDGKRQLIEEYAIRLVY